MPTIASRAEWGARYRDGVGNRPVGRLEKYLHHTVTAHLPENAPEAQERAQMRVVEGIGQDRFGAGMSYNFLIFPSGRIYTGASVHRIAYHSGGAADGRQRNTLGVGICLVGNYDTHELGDKTEAAIVWLLQEGVRRGWWTDPALTEAHRDFKSTSCPGRGAYARLGAINETARGEAVAAPVPVAPAPAPVPADESWDGPGLDPEATRAVQEYLAAVGWYLGAIDGVYARLTARAVRFYQAAQRYRPGVVADGQWGPVTQAHMEWTRELQAALNGWRAVRRRGRLVVDGNLGNVTVDRVRGLQADNAGGAYPGRVDGVPGPLTCRTLGIRSHPGA